MKLQHIIVIFVIIVVPISIVLSGYINSHIKTINNQTLYNNILINATYDGIKAFQLNTANNMYSTIANSKIRDIEAAINVFFGSLAMNLGVSGYTKEELKPFVPAILVTLYDGYYVYSNFYDTVSDSYKYGLKPFSYYSCRYINGKDDFVVNYTLDNTITIIGTVGGKYVVKSGHLLVEDNRADILPKEELKENLIILDDNNQDGTKKEEFEYIVYNGQKIYKDNDEANKYFYYSSEYRKDYIVDLQTIEYLNNHMDGGILKSDNALKYYQESLDPVNNENGTTSPGFTQWIKDNLGHITQDDAVDVDGNHITDFATKLGNEKIFDINNTTNNPLKTASTFNEHRMNVIRRSIENNLISALSTFSSHTVIGYDFSMPKIEEVEWDKIVNNVCMVSFFEGMPIGSKVFNNYCVASNNTNQETVGNDDVFIIDDKGEYHKPGCKRVVDGSLNIIGAYPASEFQRKTVSVTGEDSNAHSQLVPNADDGKYVYYYPEEYTPCYDCIIASSGIYPTDDIISGTVGNSKLKKIYLTALARSRYNLYISNGYFGH